MRVRTGPVRKRRTRRARGRHEESRWRTGSLFGTSGLRRGQAFLELLVDAPPSPDLDGALLGSAHNADADRVGETGTRIYAVKSKVAAAKPTNWEQILLPGALPDLQGETFASNE